MPGTATNRTGRSLLAAMDGQTKTVRQVKSAQSVKIAQSVHSTNPTALGRRSFRSSVLRGDFWATCHFHRRLETKRAPPHPLSLAPSPLSLFSSSDRSQFPLVRSRVESCSDEGDGPRQRGTTTRHYCVCTHCSSTGWTTNHVDTTHSRDCWRGGGGNPSPNDHSLFPLGQLLVSGRFTLGSHCRILGQSPVAEGSPALNSFGCLGGFGSGKPEMPLIHLLGLDSARLAGAGHLPDVAIGRGGRGEGRGEEHVR